jgi:hypothetical protein
MKLPLRVSKLRCLAVLLLLTAAPPCSAEEGAAEPSKPLFNAEEIDQLVAPIALYPDPLLAQIFMASTYPLEIVEAARWQKAHPDLKDKALEDALQEQPWDPSVKSLVAFPEVLVMMNDKLDWTQKLGDACLAQQNDVMIGVQRLRAKAKEEGNLETTKEQTVTVDPTPMKVEQNVTVQQPPPPQVITIQPANPQVIYVPTYNPTVVYGTWPYPAYPPYSYYPPGYVATASLFSFGVGMAVGAALWGNCNWGGCCGSSNNNIKINVNNYNNFNRTNISNGNWNHNPQHRKGVGYRGTTAQQRYGNRGPQARQQAAAREAYRGRAAAGREQMARGGAGNRGQKPGAGGQRQRPAGAPGAAKGPGAGARNPAAAPKARQGGATGAGQRQPRAQQPRAGASTRQANQGGSSAFSGMGSGGAARQQSARGRASRGGGGGRGGGGRGGGFRR